MKVVFAALFVLGFYPSVFLAQNQTVCAETGIETDNLDLLELEAEVVALDIDFVGCGTLCVPIEGDCSHCVSLVIDGEEGLCLDLEEFNTANATNVTEVCCQEIVNGVDSFCGVPSFIVISQDNSFTFDSPCSLESTPQPTDRPSGNPTKNPTPSPVDAPVGSGNTPPPTLPPFESSATTLQVSVALFLIPFLVLRYL